MGPSFKPITTRSTLLLARSSRRRRALILQLSLDEILDFVHLLFLLVQKVQDDTHGRLLQAHALNLVLHPVLHVAESQGAVDQDH